jgi:hypothetical protein
MHHESVAAAELQIHDLPACAVVVPSFHLLLLWVIQDP